MFALTNLTENHEAQQQFDQIAGLFSWGTVADAGAIVSVGSGDWFVIANSTGNYTVVFRQPRLYPPAVMVAPVTALTYSVSPGVASFTVIFGAPTNTQFSFVAVG